MSFLKNLFASSPRTYLLIALSCFFYYGTLLGISNNSGWTEIPPPTSLQLAGGVLLGVYGFALLLTAGIDFVMLTVVTGGRSFTNNNFLAHQKYSFCRSSEEFLIFQLLILAPLFLTYNHIPPSLLLSCVQLPLFLWGAFSCGVHFHIGTLGIPIFVKSVEPAENSYSSEEANNQPRKPRANVSPGYLGL